jgi:cob(I)alamin adenosyltransferase
MGIWRQIGEYLWIVKKDPSVHYSKMTKAMHFINRLSILLFILAMIILLIQLISR